MVADPFTKGLPPKVFHEHTARMGVMSFDDIQFQWEFVILDALMITNIFSVIIVYGYFEVIFCRNKILDY